MEWKMLLWRAAGVGMAGLVSLPGGAAEEKADISLDINIDYGNDPFYTEMWFWILIAVLLLFLLVQLIRGGRRSRRKARLTAKYGDSGRNGGKSTVAAKNGSLVATAKNGKSTAAELVEQQAGHAG